MYLKTVLILVIVIEINLLELFFGLTMSNVGYDLDTSGGLMPVSKFWIVMLGSTLLLLAPFYVIMSGVVVASNKLNCGCF